MAHDSGRRTAHAKSSGDAAQDAAGVSRTGFVPRSASRGGTGRTRVRRYPDARSERRSAQHGEEVVNARNRVFMILGLLTVGSLVWYLLTARTSSDLHLIGT